MGGLSRGGSKFFGWRGSSDRGEWGVGCSIHIRDGGRGGIGVAAAECRW